jgi:protein TonB
MHAARLGSMLSGAPHPEDTMLRNLLESGAAPTRRAGGTAISVAAHTAAIALALVATARATAVKSDGDKPDRDLVYRVATPSVEKTTHSQRGRPLPSIFVVPPVIKGFPSPTIIPDHLPQIDLAPGPPSDFCFDCSGASLARSVLGDSDRLVHPRGGVYIDRLVEKAAAPRPGNPAPLYPVALRAAQIEGTVLARFIVDTTGRAEPASIQFPEATHAQFADAVKQALLKSRYLPAMLNGGPVRQLVEQRFAFTLTR